MLTEISKHYPYVVLDNEAGLENLSRRIVQKVDLLIMVTDPSRRGLETIGRLHALALEMETKYQQLAIIINRLRSNDLPPQVTDLKKQINADFVIGLPDNDQLAALSEQGQPILDLEPGNPMIERLDFFIEKMPSATRGGAF